MQGASIEYHPVASGESRAFYKGPGFKGDGATPVMLGFHGFTGTFKDPANFETPEGYLVVAATAARVCCTASWGGDAWGNLATVGTGGHVDTALAALAAVGAHTSDNIWLYGGSMGAAPACNWARRNLSKVSAMALIQPAVNLGRIHDENLFGVGAAQIEAAYGGLIAWNTAKPQHNPIEYAAEFNGQIPIRVWYSTGDGTINPADPPAFAALAGASTVIQAGAPPHATIPLMSDVLAFLRSA